MNRNPRRVALERLRSIKSSIAGLVSLWDQRQTTWAPAASGDHPENWEPRPRLASEKAENNPILWAALALEAERAAADLLELANWARIQRRAAYDRQDGQR